MFQASFIVDCIIALALFLISCRFIVLYMQAKQAPAPSKVERLTEEELLRDLDAHGAHADELFEPSVDELCEDKTD